MKRPRPMHALPLQPLGDESDPVRNMKRAAVVTQTLREMAAVCRFVPAPLEADLVQR